LSNGNGSDIISSTDSGIWVDTSNCPCIDPVVNGVGVILGVGSIQDPSNVLLVELHEDGVVLGNIDGESIDGLI